MYINHAPRKAACVTRNSNRYQQRGHTRPSRRTGTRNYKYLVPASIYGEVDENKIKVLNRHPRW